MPMDLPEYTCLTRNHYTVDDYDVVPLREADIFKIKQWRNEQMIYLRQREPLTDKQQQEYYDTVVRPGFTQSQPSQILFSFLLNGECIGYGGLVHIDWEGKRAEFSFLAETSRTRDHALERKELQLFLSVMKQVAFDDLRFNRIHTETYGNRPQNILAVEECGMKREGCLRQHNNIDGQMTDSVLHGVLRTEYEQEQLTGDLSSYIV